ncbi:glycosyltransferase [Arcticibacter svalbardensis MN12-7]|uniref:Glycosyltransferase n=1 Tax=Arcticibacter svalbardensis MN12-7 TaxID=1150600 RepID=R9GR06_9SPHI|nr:glycosyltransferase family 4 protein [Arcticibacter svalbardensis]EOR94262.1 glycosyltransferase [Arcticibacter svalbardensis MN12-7]
MEILFISHKYPPALGGMEKQSFELINGLKPYLKVHSIVYEGKESRLSFFLKLNQRIILLCKENQGISIIHFNDALVAAWSLTHKGYSHLKRTMTVHGLDIVFPSRIYQHFVLPKFNRFDLIFAVSRATAEACILRGISPGKVVVVNNGVDTSIKPSLLRADIAIMMKEKYHLDCTDKRILVAMGRPVKRKGFSWFIQNVLPKLHEDFILLLIGPSVEEKTDFKNYLFKNIPSFIRKPMELFLGYPSDRQTVITLIKNPLISGRVKNLGKLPFTDIINILGIAEALIMPNIYIKGDMEGFGLVGLEASMCGTKVIASGIEGITDAVHPGKNGILLPTQDANAWIDALNQLINEPKKMNRADIINYTKQQFNWKKMTDHYLSFFKKLITEQRQYTDTTL